MRNALPLLGLLALASCVSEYRKGREDFYEGVRQLGRDPQVARDYFKESDEHFQAAIANGGLSLRQRVSATSYRIRALIELDRHQEARDLSAAPIDGYDPGLAFDGDPVGISLIRSHALDPERAFAELLVADRMAGTVQARVHVAWEQVHALEKLGKPQSKALAVRLCEQNAGKLDFDEMKKRLGGS